jgi:hypothetical protein
VVELGGQSNVNVEEWPQAGKVITPNLKIFRLAELKCATRNFRPDTVLGEGGFGRVFKGWLDETTYAPSKVGVGIAVAVKKSNPDSTQGLKEWVVCMIHVCLCSYSTSTSYEIVLFQST